MPDKPTEPRIGQRGVYAAPNVEIRAIDEAERTVELAFSSEEPIERFFGIEILDHSEGAARLERLNNGGAVLIDHRASIRDQIAVIQVASIGDDRVGRATVRFRESALAEEVFRDVIGPAQLSKISVGFLIHAEEIIRGEANAPDTFRITDWEPLELSFVAIPADDSVGVGRDINHQVDDMPDDNKPDAVADDTKSVATDTATVTQRDIDDAVRVLPLSTTVTVNEPKPMSTEQRAQHDRDIRTLGEQYGEAEAAEEYVSLGATVERFQQLLLKKRENHHGSVPSSAPRAAITGGVGTYSPQSLRHFGGDEQRAYRAGMWARAVVYQDGRAARWCNDHDLNMRALSEGVLTAGGALVPDEMAASIIDLREQFGAMRRLARVVPMGSDTLLMPRRTGSGSAAWTGENTTITQGNATFDQVQLVAKKLAGLTLISTELAEDAVIDVAAYLAEDFAQVFAESEDDAWLNGDGTSTYGGITGIRVKIIDGTHTAGAVDAASGIDTLAEITAADLDSVVAVLPAFALTNTQWLGSSPANALVFQALAAASGGTTMTERGGLRVSAYAGWPIQVSQKMPTSTGDLSNVAMILVGDFSRASTVGDRRGFRVQILTERYADQDSIGVKVTERIDIVNHDLGDNTTAGPVAALVGE